MTAKQLLQEAKEKYQIGTKFCPAHLDDNNGVYYCIVTNREFKFDRDEDSIYSLTDDGSYWIDNEKYGNCFYNRIVYCDGKWAEIIK